MPAYWRKTHMICGPNLVSWSSLMSNRGIPEPTWSTGPGGSFDQVSFSSAASIHGTSQTGACVSRKYTGQPALIYSQCKDQCIFIFSGTTPGWFLRRHVRDFSPEETTTNDCMLLSSKKDTHLTINIRGANNFDPGSFWFLWDNFISVWKEQYCKHSK